MSRRQSHRPVTLIRRALFVALLLFVAGVSALYFFGRAAGPRNTDTADPADTSEDLVLVGEGFDYEVSDGERALFHIKAARILSDKEENVELEQVIVDVGREDGSTYRVESERGTYNVTTREALLEGSVKMSDETGGLELRGESFELRRRGRLFVSTAPVDFTVEDSFEGRADDLKAYLKKDRYVLEGAVELTSIDPERPGAGLTADRIYIERQEHVVRAEGDVVLTRGGDVLRADRLGATLAEDEKTVRSVRGFWNVSGSLAAPSSSDMTSSASFSGDRFSLLFDETGRFPRQAELEGAEGAPAVLETVDGGGHARRLVAPHVFAELSGGELRHAEVYKNIELREYLAFAPDTLLRRACAETAEAEFDADGQLTSMLLETGVDLQEPDLQALGRELRLEETTGVMTLAGSPATIVSDQGQVDAPSFTHSRAEGSVTARGGVSALLPGSSAIDLSTTGGDDRGPIRVTAKVAIWNDDPQTVLFLNEARAWQGEDYLVADRIFGEADEDRLTAEGAVRTVIVRRESPEETAGEGADDELPPAPIEVTATKLVYERPVRQFTYSGGARAHQQGRSMRCDELSVLLDEDDEFDHLTCVGQTIIEDPDAGNTVTGRQADYDPANGTVEVTGSPAVLRDQEGAVIRGTRMTYDFESGTARMHSTDPDEVIRALEDEG